MAEYRGGKAQKVRNAPTARGRGRSPRGQQRSPRCPPARSLRAPARAEAGWGRGLRPGIDPCGVLRASRVRSPRHAAHAEHRISPSAGGGDARTEALPGSGRIEPGGARRGCCGLRNTGRGWRGWGSQRCSPSPLPQSRQCRWERRCAFPKVCPKHVPGLSGADKR